MLSTGSRLCRDAGGHAWRQVPPRRRLASIIAAILIEALLLLALLTIGSRGKPEQPADTPDELIAVPILTPEPRPVQREEAGGATPATRMSQLPQPEAQQ